MGIAIDGLNVTDLSSGYWFEVYSGGLSDPASVRGVDILIPGLAGLTATNRIAERREISLRGIVIGADGATGPTTFRTRMDALRAVCDPTADPFDLVVSAPDEGLSTGQSATINVRFLRFVVTAQWGNQVRHMDIEFESVDSPPEWVITGGGS